MCASYINLDTQRMLVDIEGNKGGLEYRYIEIERIS